MQVLPLPDITVNGDGVLMTLATDGNWYAYIADDASVAAISEADPNAQDANPGHGSFGDNTCDSPTPVGTDSADVVLWRCY